jgi:hypothetical protein
MFEERKARRAAQEHQEALSRWQAQRDGYAELLNLALNFKGIPCREIMLGPGEALFYKVTGASLIEDRHARGHYVGRSSGVSVPIGIGGMTLRYRVGASSGHYVQGAVTPTAVDTGTVYITNKRMIFQGARQTRECAFSKLIGFRHSDSEETTTFSVSNRQKPTTIRYGPKLSSSFDFRLDLALSHFNGTLRNLVQQLQAELVQIDGRRPTAPARVGT